MPNQDQPDQKNRTHAKLGSTTLSLEFTVEPFVESNPGPHVQAAIAAATDVDDLLTDVGPFGTVVSGPRNQVLEATQQILEAAFASGASRISLQLTAE